MTPADIPEALVARISELEAENAELRGIDQRAAIYCRERDAATAEAARLRAENENLKQDVADARTKLDALVQEVLRNG